MENKEKLQKITNELVKKEGNIIGDVVKSHEKFIRFKEGDEGLKKIEEETRELGYPVDFKNIKPQEWYPVFLPVIIFVIAKDTFKWNKDDIKESATFVLKNSFILKTVLRYFVSVDRLPEIFLKFWKKSYDFGELEIVSMDKDRKKMIIRIKNYDVHPINCIAFSAMGKEMVKYVTAKEDVDIKETKCIHKGDEFHEYIVTW